MPATKAPARATTTESSSALDLNMGVENCKGWHGQAPNPHAAQAAQAASAALATQAALAAQAAQVAQAAQAARQPRQLIVLTLPWGVTVLTSPTGAG